MKTCTQCRKSKPESKFYSYRDKPQKKCKTCVSFNNRCPKMVKAPAEPSYKDHLIKANMYEDYKRGLKYQV